MRSTVLNSLFSQALFARLGAATIARILLVLITGAFFWFGCFDGLQRLVEDQRFSIATRGTTGQLLLVDIDEPSIAALGVWPWTRAVHAAIVDRLMSLGAADVAFDVDFSSPSSADGDAAFEKALKDADGSVILAALQQVVQTASGPVLVASRPLSRFAAHGWEASVNVWPDSDGHVRQLNGSENFGSETLPALAMLLSPQSGRLQAGTFGIDYGIDYGKLAHLSVHDLLHGVVDPALVRDRKVIVGASAVELRDFFQVPRFGFMAGSAVQAMAVESILQKRTLSHLSAPLNLLLLAISLGALSWLTRRLAFGPALACCAGFVVVLEAFAVVVQDLWPLVLSTAPIHAGALGLAAIIVADEGVARRLKLLASRRHANRLRVMLDRVIADNFAGIIIIDQSGSVCAASAAAATLLSTNLGGAETQVFDEVLPGPLADLVSGALADLRLGCLGKTTACEVIVRQADRPALLLDCVVTVSEIAGAQPGAEARQDDYAICLTFRDITAERQAHEKLSEMARIDSLSGLANRAVLLAAVEDRVRQRRAGASALIFLNLDRFKLVNDRLGHSSGDAMIQAVASRLRTLAQAEDVIARLGGDEFAIVVDRPTKGDIEACAALIAHHLSGTYDLGLFQTAMTISIGLAFFEEQNTTAMMSDADAALYAAKASGGACIRLYDAAMEQQVAEDNQIAQELRVAVERGEFEVVYQRQVDALTERIVGVEALVRWKHPQRGYVSPAKFIPIAERTGLIEPIGMLVLATACREAATWPEPIKVSVNLSAVQLAQSNLADLILATLAETALPPSRLDLELTESLLLDDGDLVRTTLGRLRAARVRISLDDFGTGYSSLSYLNRFAIDKIKIDQSFVRSMESEPSAVAIIRAVVGLARDIGLRVNVEGVETSEQLSVLQQLGCDEVQGYLHGRPEPSAAIEASLLQQNVSPTRVVYELASEPL